MKFAVLLLVPVLVQARVTKIEITARTPAAFAGYEKIKGVASGELDPKDKRNTLITDIALAPRNANGRVEYRTNFTMMKPVDMTTAPGVLFYNVVNRGTHGGTAEFHVGGDPGDGFLYKLGHVVLWSGWQGDIPLTTDGSDREGIEVPVVTGVTGPVWERFTGVTGNTRALTRTHSAGGRLTSASSETPAGVQSGLVELPASDWAFADCRTTPFPGTPDPLRLCVKNGFDPSLLYELVYTAKDPLLLGAGMTAMRDVVAYFRYDKSKDNPLAGTISHSICMGNSQTGRMEKTFLNLGFNEDENGRMVCDGMNSRIAGMLGGFNVRFAKPGDIAELYDPGSDGPLWWSDYKDEVRGRPSWGILHRCEATKTCPKITETYGGPEIWYARATIGITGTGEKKDLPLPANVRRYYHPGTPHGGGRGGFALGAPSKDPNALADNPNPERETDRALYVALVNWVVKNTPPPPSAYPNLKDGTLVKPTSEAMGWPAIPNTPKPDGVINPLFDYAYGAAFQQNDEAGAIDTVPPAIRKIILPLVPKVDADGNELGGVPSLLHRLPLGTYTGWNPIPAGPLKGRERSLAGGYIPFAKTKAERIASGDPRLSIAERYQSAEDYYKRASAEAAKLMQQGFLLPDDAARLLEQVKTDLAASNLWR